MSTGKKSYIIVVILVKNIKSQKFTINCPAGHIASKVTIIWRFQVQSWLQVSNNTRILNTCTRLWLTESEQATPVDSIKDVVQSSRVRQTPEEG